MVDPDTLTLCTGSFSRSGKNLGLGLELELGFFLALPYPSTLGALGWSGSCGKNASSRARKLFLSSFNYCQRSNYYSVSVAQRRAFKMEIPSVTGCGEA